MQLWRLIAAGPVYLIIYSALHIFISQPVVQHTTKKITKMISQPKASGKSSSTNKKPNLLIYQLLQKPSKR